MKTINVTFTPEKIKGKDRPRYRRVGKFVQTYTTKSTKCFELGLREQFLEQVGSIYGMYDGRIEMYIEIYIAMPKSWSNRLKTTMNGTSHTNKPDIDNIIKAILDSLNGLAYNDDKNICSIHVTKKWDFENRIDVSINYLDKIKDLD